MGAGASSGAASQTLAILVLSAAVLYVAWRHSQTQQELRSLRSLVDASVSLHELEEQVMPAIDTLEQEAARLKREMQQLARQAAASGKAQERTTTTTPERVEAPHSEAEREEEDQVRLAGGGDAAVTWALPQELSPEFSLLMGMGSLLSGPSSPAQLSATGMPMARVLISSMGGRHESACPTVEEVPCDEEGDSDEEPQRDAPLMRTERRLLPPPEV